MNEVVIIYHEFYAIFWAILFISTFVRNIFSVAQIAVGEN